MLSEQFLRSKRSSHLVLNVRWEDFSLVSHNLHFQFEIVLKFNQKHFPNDLSKLFALGTMNKWVFSKKITFNF